jgi:(S)-ureidoglycine aminohydrolase
VEFVVSEHDVESRTEPGDTAAVRTTIDRSTGSERLEQRVIRFGRGRSSPRRLEGSQEVLYVASGTGALELDGGRHELEPGTGVYIAPGEEYAVDNPGPDEVVAVAVRAPGAAPPGPNRRVTVRWADQPSLPAGTTREFRYLINQDAGCPDVTQFLGVIVPSRVPDHSHVYDEVIYVLEGEGTLHIDDRHTPIAAGSCIHLPPLLVHCLENHGAGPMRVLGVFHPSGDPASRAYDEER